MRSLHGAAMLEATLGAGIIEGNPFHAELLDIARRVGVDFLVDVAINRDRQLTGVFAGDLERAHAAGVRLRRTSTCSAELDAPADVVITSAGGFPLDDTYYQSIKGMIAALNIVRRGGTIMLAAAISRGHRQRGVPAPARARRDGNDEFMARITSPGFFRIDQWMVQHLCQVRRKAEVILVSGGCVEAARGLCWSPPRRSVEDALARCLAGYGAARARRGVAAGPVRPRHGARSQAVARPRLDRRRGVAPCLIATRLRVGSLHRYDEAGWSSATSIEPSGQPSGIASPSPSLPNAIQHGRSDAPTSALAAIDTLQV